MTQGPALELSAPNNQPQRARVFPVLTRCAEEQPTKPLGTWTKRLLRVLAGLNNVMAVGVGLAVFALVYWINTRYGVFCIICAIEFGVISAVIAALPAGEIDAWIKRRERRPFHW